MAQADVKAGLRAMMEQEYALAISTSPKHGYALIQVLDGMVRACYRDYPSDPALAACHLIERIPAMQGILDKAMRWAQAVNACDPSDIPDVPARLTP